MVFRPKIRRAGDGIPKAAGRAKQLMKNLPRDGCRKFPGEDFDCLRLSAGSALLQSMSVMISDRGAITIIEGRGGVARIGIQTCVGRTKYPSLKRVKAECAARTAGQTSRWKPERLLLGNRFVKSIESSTNHVWLPMSTGRGSIYAAGHFFPDRPIDHAGRSKNSATRGFTADSAFFVYEKSWNFSYGGKVLPL